MSNPDEQRTSFIPPNFIEKGKILNGTFDIRNAIEAIIFALLIGGAGGPPAVFPDYPHHHPVHDCPSGGHGIPHRDRRREHHCFPYERPSLFEEPAGGLPL